MAPLLLAPVEGWVALQALLGSFFPLLVHFHLELHRNTDKVGSVITFSVCFFVCISCKNTYQSI